MIKYWMEELRDRLGYYPGHEPSCPERQVPFEVSTCFCGPKEEEMSDRPSFQDINMRYALDLAERSTCLRGTKVGCVITSPDFRKVLALGYNGNASGLPNKCDRTGEAAVGNCGCLHAEENAVINCDEPRGTTKIVFCTHLPCVMCAKRLINLGNVEKIWYRNDYRIRDSIDVLKQVNIEIEMLTPKCKDCDGPMPCTCWNKRT